MKRLLLSCIVFFVLTVSGCSDRGDETESSSDSQTSQHSQASQSEETQLSTEDSVNKAGSIERSDGFPMYPDKEYIESPVEAVLEVNKLIAKVTFTNISEEDVVINRNIFGGSTLRTHVFHLNPYYISEPNITFTPYDSSPEKEAYFSMKPGEEIVVETDLRQYYQFDTYDYEQLAVVYLFRMNLLNTENQEVLTMNPQGKKIPISFAVRSESVLLEYSRDIQPFLED